MCCKRVCVCVSWAGLCPKLSGALWVLDLIAELRPFLTVQPVARDDLIHGTSFKKTTLEIMKENL